MGPEIDESDITLRSPEWTGRISNKKSIWTKAVMSHHVRSTIQKLGQEKLVRGAMIKVMGIFGRSPDRIGI